MGDMAEDYAEQGFEMDLDGEDYWDDGYRNRGPRKVPTLKGEAYKRDLDDKTKSAMAAVGLKTWAVACAAEDQRLETRRRKLLALMGPRRAP